MDGQLERAGDDWRLRFVRHLAHPPETVWRAITVPEHLATWFPDRVVGEFAAGARLRFASDHVDAGFFDGEVLVADPPTTLEFRWGSDLLRFEISPVGNGCVLTLLDTIDAIGKAARDGAGWHVCLDKLEQHLRGETPGCTDDVRWREVHRRYLAAFPPEAAAIGPPQS